MTERGQRRPGRDRASGAGAWVFAALVVILPVARGGVDPGVALAATLLATGAFLLSTWETPEVPRLALPLAVALAATALQAVPVPPVVHALSPGARSLFEGVLGPIGLYPAARPLSVDPPSTAHAIATGLSALAAFCLGWSVSATHRRRAALTAAIALAGIGAAVAVLGAALAAGRALLAPTFPLVNPNHLGGLLDLTSFVALGLALRARGAARALWVLGFVVTSAVIFLSLSRGGMGGWLAGLAAFVALESRRRAAAGGASRPGARGAVLGGLSAAGAIAALLALDPILVELKSVRNAPGEVKLQLLRPALQLALDFPWTGAGRGAFATAFAGYKLETTAVTFTHVENGWVQVLCDLGLPVGLLLLAGLGWAWLRGAGRAGDARDTGLLAGTAALGLHELVDFSLEVPAIALAFFAALGLLQRGAPVLRPGRLALRAGLALAAAAAVGGAVAATRSAVAGAALAGAGAEAVPAAAARAAAARPADYLPHAVAGAKLAEAGRCREAMGWLLRAMRLNPTAPEPHWYAARCLAAHGRDAPAKREFRLAYSFGATAALSDAARRWSEVRDLLEVAPDTPPGLFSLGYLLLEDRPADACEVFRRALETFEDRRALLPLAQCSAAAGRFEDAAEWARAQVAWRPSDPEGHRLLARALYRLDRAEEAEAALHRALQAQPGSLPLLAELANRELEARRYGAARRYAEAIAPKSTDEFARKQLLIAHAFARQGRTTEAIGALKSATAALPDAVPLLTFLADLYALAGRDVEAAEALEHAAAVSAGDRPRLAAKIAELRARANRRAVEKLGEAAR